MDIKNLSLEPGFYKLYEKMSVEIAIAQMDDMGWCPQPGCA